MAEAIIARSREYDFGRSLAYDGNDGSTGARPDDQRYISGKRRGDGETTTCAADIMPAPNVLCGVERLASRPESLSNEEERQFLTSRLPRALLERERGAAAHAGSSADGMIFPSNCQTLLIYSLSSLCDFTSVESASFGLCCWLF